MYGSGNKSFHEQWKKSLPGTVTFKTRGTDTELQNLLVPKLAALLPADNYQQGAQNTLILHTGNINNAVGRDNIINAFAVGEKAVCLARLNAANVYEQTQNHNVQNLAAAHQNGLNAINAASGDGVNTACLTAIAAMQNT